MHDHGQHADDGLSDLERRLRDADRSIDVPPALLERLATALNESPAPRPRRLALVTTARIAAAIAVLLTAALVSATLSRRTSPHLDDRAVATVRDRGPAPAVVRFDPDSNLFARTIPTTRPNITIVRIYSGVALEAAPETTEGSES